VVEGGGGGVVSAWGKSGESVVMVGGRDGSCLVWCEEKPQWSGGRDVGTQKGAKDGVERSFTASYQRLEYEAFVYVYIY